LIIGAHPDDPDLMFGGCAVKLARQGHSVKFVSCTDGGAGHYRMDRESLVERRRREAQASAAVAGLSGYDVLDHRDGELVPSLDFRRQLVSLIRDFMPDLVVTHRVFDYHADHRATAQAVQDASFLVGVPMFDPRHTVPDATPIYVYGHDRFCKPCPFRADVAVSIDDVVDQKLRMLDCHASQFYEWLPFNLKRLEQVPTSTEERFAYLARGWLCRNRDQAEAARERLARKYGDAKTITYAESFEVSEYGRQPEAGELDALFEY